MFLGVALAPATARLARHGHLPWVLFGGLPAGVVSAPTALVGRPLAADVDAALAHALDALSAVAPIGGEPARGSARRTAPPGPTPTIRPDRRLAAGPAAPVHPPDGFPDRAAGPGATVHGAAGGPSRLVHHLAPRPFAAGAAGALMNAPSAPAPPTPPASADTGRVGGAPRRSAPASASATAPTRPPDVRVSPRIARATPLRVERDEATAALLRSLVAPPPATIESTGGGGSPANTVPPRPPRVDDAAFAAAPPGRAPAPGAAPNASGSTALARSTPHPRPSEAVPSSAPADLVELVRWWETATPLASAVAPTAGAGPGAEPPLPVTSRVDDPRADDPGDVGADPLSTFRDALELVLLDEAFADGLEVG